MITSKQRAALRGLGTALEPTYQIGKGEILPVQIEALDAQIEKRELIKIGVLRASPINAKEAAEILAQKLKAEVVAVTGGKILLYRRSKSDKVKRIEF